MMRRFGEALRSASDALAAAADAAREGPPRHSDQGACHDDDRCYERHHRHRHSCCAGCPHCGHLEDRCWCPPPAAHPEAREDCDSSGAEEPEGRCCGAHSAPLPPYPPYPPVPAHAPFPPHPPFPPYPPYIIIAPGSGCGCHQGGAAPAMAYGSPGGSPPHAPAAPGGGGVPGGNPNMTVAGPSPAGKGPLLDSIMSGVAPSFPDPSGLTDIDALLDLGERAAATVRELVPTDRDPQEAPDV
jgi:hypothetical protein